MFNTIEMQSRVESLTDTLEHEVRLLERQTVHQHRDGKTREERKADVGRLLMELGALQIRLIEAGWR